MKGKGMTRLQWFMLTLSELDFDGKNIEYWAPKNKKKIKAR